MAHIIHLATRALISTYSQAPFYNPEQTELELSIENGHRDEVGLIRAICVKVFDMNDFFFFSVDFAIGQIFCSKKTALQRYPTSSS